MFYVLLKDTGMVAGLLVNVATLLQIFDQVPNIVVKSSRVYSILFGKMQHLSIVFSVELPIPLQKNS
jgi:hypothetical protein